MPAAIDAGNVVGTPASPGNTNPTTLNVTCGASDNFLLVLVGDDQAVVNGPPSGITYNGVALTLLGSQSYTSSYRGNASIWYLNTPTTGSSLPLVATCVNINTGFAMVAVPMSGVNTGVAPTLGTGAFATSTAAACSSPAAGAADLQFGACFTRGTALTSGGGQTDLVAPITSINGLDSFAASSIAGPTAGNFTWTLPSGNWIGLACTVFGASPILVAGTGLYTIGGQSVILTTTISNNFVLLVSPGLYNITGALPNVANPTLSLGTGIYSIAGQAATMVVVTATTTPSPIKMELYEITRGTIALAWSALASPGVVTYQVSVNDQIVASTALDVRVATVTGLAVDTPYLVKIVGLVYSVPVVQSNIIAYEYGSTEIAYKTVPIVGIPPGN